MVVKPRIAAPNAAVLYEINDGYSRMRSNKVQDKPSPGASSSVDNPQELMESAEVVSDRSARKNKFELS